jgi:serine phosphatase RsbU (regulator of sigma subunit)
VENGPLDSLEKTVENVMVKVKEHAGTAPQSDDIAMLMIRYNG